MQYRCVAASPTGFVQQLAVHYLLHGYWFYVHGDIPGYKDPSEVDTKLIDKYGIGVSRQSRSRRKTVGIANLHYIRFDRTFLLLATHGHHPFYDQEGANIRDARKIPIKFQGYSISVQKGGYLRKTSDSPLPIRDDHWRVRVQIRQKEYANMKAYFVERSIRVSAESLASELFNVPYEPYAPVRQQLLNIVRLVNDARRKAGMHLLDYDVLRYRRRIVKPFGSAGDRKGMV